jgi:phosphate transport system protein
MRGRFDEELSILNNELIEMGALIEHAIARAAKALELNDVALAQQIIDSDDTIDNKEKDIESRCLKLLLMQQPVARDLSQISTALKMITDMERIGDHASDISELVIYLSEQRDIITPEHIRDMAKATIKMVADSIDAYVRRDLELANAVIKYDDVVDALFASVKKELIQLVHADASLGEAAIDYLQVAKYYERIGDHAENIAEWVIFFLTGIHKDKQVL